MKTPPATSLTTSALEHTLARILAVSVWCSALLMATGLVVSAFHPMTIDPHPPPLSLHTVVRDLMASPFHPVNFLSLGLIVLMCAPILRVGAALFGFAAARNRTYVILSLVVLLLLVGEITYSLFIV